MSENGTELDQTTSNSIDKQSKNGKFHLEFSSLNWDPQYKLMVSEAKWFLKNVVAVVKSISPHKNASTQIGYFVSYLCYCVMLHWVIYNAFHVLFLLYFFFNLRYCSVRHFQVKPYTLVWDFFRKSRLHLFIKTDKVQVTKWSKNKEVIRQIHLP